MPAKSKKKPAKAVKPAAKKAAKPAKSAKPATKKTAKAPKAAAKPQTKAASRKKPTGRKRGRPTLSPHGLVGSNISLRMPPELYGYLKKTGKNWQTRVVRHLMAEMEKKAAWMKA